MRCRLLSTNKKSVSKAVIIDKFGLCLKFSYLRHSHIIDVITWRPWVASYASTSTHSNTENTLAMATYIDIRVP